MKSTVPLVFGAESHVYSHYPGTLDEIRLWRTARTAAEIRAAKDVRLRGNEAGLVAYWPLNEGMGDAYDIVNALAAHLGGVPTVLSAVPTWTADSAPVQ